MGHADTTTRGTVRFTDDGSTIAGCVARPVAGGTASCATAPSTVGNHVIVAMFSGITGYSGSTSAGVTEQVNCDGCNLAGANLAGANLDGVNWTSATCPNGTVGCCG